MTKMIRHCTSALLIGIGFIASPASCRLNEHLPSMIDNEVDTLSHLHPFPSERMLQTTSEAADDFTTLEGRFYLNEFLLNDQNITSHSQFLFAPFNSEGAELGQQYFVYLTDDQRAEYEELHTDGKDLVVSITSAAFDETNGIIKRAVGSEITLSTEPARKKRKLVQKMGTVTVMGVSISLGSTAPMYSNDQWYQILFQNPVSLYHQYRLCSWGKFNPVPNSLGVISVNVNLPTNSNPQAVINQAQTAALQHIASIGRGSFTNLADFVDMILFMTPDMGTWLAYAAVGGATSVFNNKWAGYVASNMHETGHNLGLLHSHNQAGVAYLDYTGYMGGAIIGYHDKIGFPQECYNAVGMWQTGWYADRLIITNLFRPTLLRLAAFVDYNKTQKGLHYIVAKSGNVFLHYNRAKSFNSGTAMYKDSLVMYQNMAGGSYLFGALKLGVNPLYERVFAGAGVWRAKICGMFNNQPSGPDFLLISVGFGPTAC